MSKKRWIIPIRDTGRIEVTTSSDVRCDIALYDNKKTDGSGAWLDRDEMYSFIDALRMAVDGMYQAVEPKSEIPEEPEEVLPDERD